MMGVRAYVTTFFSSSPPSRMVSLVTGMFDRATSFDGTVRVTSNVALQLGSSQQGKALRASVASKCVAAAYAVVPSLRV